MQSTTTDALKTSLKNKIIWKKEKLYTMQKNRDLI